MNTVIRKLKARIPAVFAEEGSKTVKRRNWYLQYAEDGGET